MPVKKAAAKKPTTVDVDKFMQEVALGRHDDRLGELMQSVGSQALQTRTMIRWRLTLGDLVVDEDNLTLLEAERCEKLTGQSWHALDPRRSASTCAAIMQAAIECRDGVSSAEARERLAPVTVKAWADDVFSEYTVSPAPFDSAPSTNM
jgi:hypothetical protein